MRPRGDAEDATAEGTPTDGVSSPSLEAWDTGAPCGARCTGRSSDSWALRTGSPAVARGHGSFTGASQVVVPVRMPMSFPLTAAGQSRIRTGFPLTPPGDGRTSTSTVAEPAGTRQEAWGRGAAHDAFAPVTPWSRADAPTVGR
ncbi:hypothetical protein MOPEL_135_00870 [Mobilicoccus pelagius NBRC 104925]|uniref:Uncharacterized protein n=1 Tax=Mobilicoccus pelagius NBRC 104925 TaxID=1089455 RepID=H5UVU1_9MICO|nr:hypothetical protein MOPEL_135_00870 [Mobilicoccus pelagius NBRC 104925]